MAKAGIIMHTKIYCSAMSVLRTTNIVFLLAISSILLYADKLSDKLNTIKLPPGFHIDIYASGINGARSLAIGQRGTIFVGSRTEGKVYAIQDNNSDFRADRYSTIASGLNSPNGVAFRNGALYVAEIGRILRFDAIESRLNNPPAPVVVNDTFPKETHHGWKFIRFGPDGYLYIPVGVPCNICDPKDMRYGSIMRMKPDGKGLEIFAKGIRNSVGFDWHPVNHNLFFTDNGRDWMGNNKPPDELNMASKMGMHFGFPYCHGNNIVDPKFGQGKKCNDFTRPVKELGPHAAALGMRFYTGNQFPKKYKNQIFIAEHGSWNRVPPLGYRITIVSFDKNNSPSYSVFAQGWLDGILGWGRPVDILNMPDGSILVSDDKADAVYRIWYSNKK